VPTIPLPEGARRVASDGSNRYTGGEGDRVTVSPGNADIIRRYAAGRPGRGQRFGLGTKTSRTCQPCRRVWNAWSTVCPRCGQPTAADG